MTGFDEDAFWLSEFGDHLAVASASRHGLKDAFSGVLGACVACLRHGGKIIFFGNGGSAADAQHLATELSIRYSKDRPAIAALALTTDTSALTAAGNDMGFDQIFARQVEALARAGDVAIGISTSGRSQNVLTALGVARALGVVTVGLTGEGGRTMNLVCDHVICIPSKTTARIQEMHITLGHMLCGAIENSLGYV